MSLAELKGEPDLPEHPLVENKVIYLAKSFGGVRSMFCRGCGYGSIAQMIGHIFMEDKLDIHKYPIINGVGCYTMIPIIMPGKILMNLHGRGLAVATGAKMANPDLKPIIIAGDGDLLSIGTNHFIHAARRNLDCVCLLLHNLTFGMTGGQIAPTAQLGQIASTARHGYMQEMIDAVEMAKVAGGTYIARCTTAQPIQFMKYFRKALNHKGFALIDVVSQCVTYFGRHNKMSDPVAVFNWIKENTLTIKQAESMSKDELKTKFVTGEFVEIQKPTLMSNYLELIEKSQGGK
ncbi:MAG: 2-oxoacid:ferredoxin oxidoreductase subunit beta [Candidatus Helarchaeota archaeon]|nr:2-oxoacid:ferredoxin oxidoreductase subunit beta [Candidatus Helarchaeota archaeon]